jgi:gamma-glutamyltranspeptidase/glutathione hydrolase
MAAGGTAIDAVIAALWTACVVEPVLASLGGGGFLLDHPASGEARVHDFFVHTPRTRRPAEEIDFHEIIADFGVAQQAFHIGYGAAAVPGFVRGVFAAHRDHGTMPMTRLVEPAVAAAKQGVECGPYEAYLFSVVGPIYRHTPAARALFTRPSAGAEPVLLREGDRFVNPEIADTLEALAREGDALFYEGALASSIAGACQDQGGHLTRDDLRHYRDHARVPLRRRFRDATLTTTPPPALGGLLIAHSLELFAQRHPNKPANPRSSDSVYATQLARVMQATNRARSELLGDHGEPRTPEQLCAILNDDARAPYLQQDVFTNAQVSQRGTTHISVIDRHGDAAAATVSNGEGCGHIVPGTGFMLNNMLGEEDINPRGLGQWATDQRMISMMAPSTLSLPDRGLVVLGSGGSNRIRTAILQVILNMVDFAMDPRAAVEAPRLHHERDHLDFEALLPAATKRALASAFPDHLSWPERNMFFGGVHTVLRTASGELRGAGDPRRAGVCL